LDRLVGRDGELHQLTRLVDSARGSGAALVVRGDPGIGKSSLLRALSTYGREVGCQVLEVTGIEPEAQLPFAGLLHLLRPVLDDAGKLPATQQRALFTAFEMQDGPAPQPFLIALASLNLLTDAAARRPVVVVVDDA